MPQGSGYNIPVSVSSATAWNINPILFEPTYFNFQSPGAQAGAGGIQSTPTLTPTATSSAAEGNAASQSKTSGTGGGGADGVPVSSGLPQASNNIMLYIILLAIAAVGYFVFIK